MIHSQLKKKCSCEFINLRIPGVYLITHFEPSHSVSPAKTSRYATLDRPVPTLYRPLVMLLRVYSRGIFHKVDLNCANLVTFKALESIDLQLDARIHLCQIQTKPYSRFVSERTIRRRSTTNNCQLILRPIFVLLRTLRAYIDLQHEQDIVADVGLCHYSQILHLKDSVSSSENLSFIAVYFSMPHFKYRMNVFLLFFGIRRRLFILDSQVYGLWWFLQ